MATAADVKTLGSNFTEETLPISKLKPNPLDAKIYDDEPSADLLQSIETHGVLEPILVTKNLLVLAGHKRIKCAKKVGMKEVPCRICQDELDELVEKEWFLASNSQRVKTNTQKAREIKLRLEIEQARAKERMATRRSKADEEEAGFTSEEGNGKVAKEEKGRALDFASQPLGWSGRTGEKALAVTEAIDEAVEAGHVKKAEKLVQTLNDSVDAAHRLIKPTRKKRERTEPESGEAAMQAWNKELERFTKKVDALLEELPEGAWAGASELAILKGQVRAVAETAKSWRGFKLCPECKGEGCAKCRKTGFVPKKIYEQIAS